MDLSQLRTSALAGDAAAIAASGPLEDVLPWILLADPNEAYAALWKHVDDEVLAAAHFELARWLLLGEHGLGESHERARTHFERAVERGLDIAMRAELDAREADRSLSRARRTVLSGLLDDESASPAGCEYFDLVVEHGPALDEAKQSELASIARSWRNGDGLQRDSDDARRCRSVIETSDTTILRFTHPFKGADDVLGYANGMLVTFGGMNEGVIRRVVGKPERRDPFPEWRVDTSVTQWFEWGHKHPRREAYTFVWPYARSGLSAAFYLALPLADAGPHLALVVEKFLRLIPKGSLRITKPTLTKLREGKADADYGGIEWAYGGTALDDYSIELRSYDEALGDDTSEVVFSLPPTFKPSVLERFVREVAESTPIDTAFAGASLNVPPSYGDQVRVDSPAPGVHVNYDAATRRRTNRHRVTVVSWLNVWSPETVAALGAERVTRELGRFIVPTTSGRVVLKLAEQPWPRGRIGARLREAIEEVTKRSRIG